MYLCHRPNPLCKLPCGVKLGSFMSSLCMTGEFALKGTDFGTLVHSILLYECKTWALTAELCRLIFSFHNRCVHRMHRHTLEQTEKYRITDASLEGKLGSQAIQATLDARCLRWVGHVARIPERRAPRCLCGTFSQARSKQSDRQAAHK